MFQRLLRYGSAAVLLVYGFAKLNGSQFTILDSELDKPMGQVSGFWLTWYYFGYSKFYGSFIALSQIAGAMLLFFRRTTLPGACILLPILINIVLVDLSYGIALSAALLAVVVGLALTLLVAPYKDQLVALFLSAPVDVAQQGGGSVAKWMVRVGLVVFAASFTYWTANYNNRAPTPIDGAWDVLSIDTLDATTPQPVTIFFECNRAHLCVYRDAGGKYEWHHFEMDLGSQTIKIWRKWLSKSDLLFSGRYQLTANSLVFNRQGDTPGQWREIRLQKRLIQTSAR